MNTNVPFPFTKMSCKVSFVEGLTLKPLQVVGLSQRVTSGSSSILWYHLSTYGYSMHNFIHAAPE
jgi:hypothetical protein